MKQAQFKNVAQCAIGGRASGDTFFLPVMDDGTTPSEHFWRKRIIDESVIFVTPIPAAPEASAVASDEAKLKKGK